MYRCEVYIDRYAIKSYFESSCCCCKYSVVWAVGLLSSRTPKRDRNCDCDHDCNDSANRQCIVCERSDDSEEDQMNVPQLFDVNDIIDIEITCYALD